MSQKVKKICSKECFPERSTIVCVQFSDQLKHIGTGVFRKAAQGR